MAAQAGRLVLIEVDSDGMGTYVAVGGMREKSISLNNQIVDVTDSDSTNQWRELLANAGVKQATISGSGVFKDSASEEDVRGYFFAGTIVSYNFEIPDFGTIEGDYQVTALEYAGTYNGEATFNMTFESAGAIAFTAA